MQVNPLHPLFAAELVGANLTAPPDEELVRTVEDAMARYGVLAIRDAEISDEQQKTFSRAFGPLEIPSRVPGAARPVGRRPITPGIFYAGNLDHNGEIIPYGSDPKSLAKGAERFHTDSSFHAMPTKWSLLHGVDTPPPSAGGDTWFVDARAAYDDLPDAMKARIENLVGLLNSQTGPLKDKRVRQAVIAAMDYDGEISALKGAGTAAHGFIPEGLVGYDDSIVQKQDLDQAKQLLQQASYGSGKKLKLTMTLAQGDDNEALTAAIFKSDLARIGVDLTVKPMQWTAQWDQAKSSNTAKRQDIFMMYWYPDYADAYSWFTSLFRSSPQPNFNLSYIKDATLDQQIDALQEKAAQGGSVAEDAYRSAQQKVQDDAIVMTFYVNNYQRAYRSSLTGYSDNPAYANVVFAYDVAPGAGA